MVASTLADSSSLTRPLPLARRLPSVCSAVVISMKKKVPDFWDGLTTDKSYKKFVKPDFSKFCDEDDPEYAHKAARLRATHYLHDRFVEERESGDKSRKKALVRHRGRVRTVIDHLVKKGMLPRLAKKEDATRRENRTPGLKGRRKISECTPEA